MNAQVKRKITKREALRKCRKLWLWLTAHPGKDKIDAYKSLGLAIDSCHCPCCQYSKDHGYFYGDGWQDCAKTCLLKSLWPHGCMQSNSKYMLWADSGYKDSKAAAKIAEACKEK